ncbi:MAG: glycosyltransferase family 4 protein, partial [Acidobacteria bacterium]|nr:glycosyltransferase family 4 protein [Acidobacteriota bacterium]
KNIEMFLEAASNFNKPSKTGTRIKFIIIGDGNLRKDLEEKARALNISDNIVFTGSRDDPEVFYPGLDIVALTSLNEGTPLSLIEAMASGKPVISTLVGGVTDLLGAVNEDHNGFAIRQRGISVESKDVSGFCLGLKHLVSEKQLRSALAENGSKYVKAEYSKARLVEDIKQLYRGLQQPDNH